MNQALQHDVVVVGSGFGGAVAALRFAEAGERVLMLERGDWVRRDRFAVGLDALWIPHRNRLGMNELRRRGRHIVTWLGAAVGGGSQVFAGTLKRPDGFAGYPAAIRDDDMTPYFELGEQMLDAAPPPGDSGAATRLMTAAGARLREEAPELVEDHGLVKLAIAFAPPGEQPGAEFINRHGSAQRYHHPAEQSLLGGDIDAKNSLDRNYLHLAQQRGAHVQALSQVDRIEPLAGGGYRIWYQRWGGSGAGRTGSVTARRVVLAAGAIGSTEILLRNRDHHRTLPGLSRRLGERYTTNGNHLSLILPFRGIAIAWAGFALMLYALIAGPWWLLVAGAAIYYLQLFLSRRSHEPDLGTTNSDYIRFRGAGGEPGGAYIEGGRYPTPVRFAIALALSLVGRYRPDCYRRIVWFTDALAILVPPFEALARSWPIPLLQMGRDRAVGRMCLDRDHRLTIDFDVAANRPFYAHMDRLGRRVARAARALWIPNLVFRLFRTLEVPHNQGGVPMGESAGEGVVDHAGRVFGYPDLMVLDGSIIPVSPGPNPALTILALSERAMRIALAQIAATGTLCADATSHGQLSGAVTGS